MPHDTQLRQNGKPQLRVVSRPSTPLDFALDIFITAKEAERCTPRTVETYRFTLVRFRDWLAAQGVRDPQGITRTISASSSPSWTSRGCRRGIYTSSPA